MLLLLPTVSVEAGGRAAWMVALMAGFGGFTSLMLVGKLGQRFPHLTMAGYAQQILGKWPGKVMVVLLAVNFGVNSWVDLAMATSNLEGIYFVNTPPWVVGVILALMALSFTWFGIVHASRLAPTMMAILFLTFVLTFPLTWRWVKPGYILPLLDASPVNPFDKPFWVAAGVIRAGLFPVVFLPYIQEPKKALRILGWGHWVGMLGNFAAVLLPVMIFGPEGARAIAQPFPYVISVIRMPNFVFERVEMIGRLAFHINTVYAISSIYFSGSILLSEVFGTKSSRPFMPVMALLSLLPVFFVPSAAQATEFGYNSVIRGLIATWTLFPLLWVVYWLRGLHRRAPNMGA